MKQKVLNIQLGNIWDAEKKKSVPVTLPAYPKKDKSGKKYFEARIRIFINEMEIKEEEKKEDTDEDL